MRLNRSHPAVFLEFSGWANYSLGDYDKALAAFEEYHERSPDDTDGNVEIIYTSATLGQLEKAKAAVAELLEKHPDFTIEGYSSHQPLQGPGGQQAHSRQHGQGGTAAVRRARSMV